MKTSKDQSSDQEQKNQKADSCVRWAAGRALTLALLPVSSDAPFLANEAYMFYRLGGIYGCRTDQKLLSSFIGCLGAGIGRQIFCPLVPSMKAPIVAGITYAFGKAAQAFFQSGMSMPPEDVQNIFRQAKNEFQTTNFQHKM